MQVLSEQELNQVSGGFHIAKLGTAIIGLAAGFITGGPVGLGIAASALVGVEGIDKLVDLYQQDPNYQPNQPQP